uniref:NACHT domain-containing protein n=1 Tax=Esox lucius TaxID=8010 RepID=A0A3P8ZQ25_ESOLU
MACTSQSASEYIKNGRKLLVGKLHDLPLIVENLFQSKVLHEEEVRKIQTEVEQFDKTEEILDWVMEKGEAACYELLVILDRTKKKTLDDPDLEHWISCFPFREDLEMTDHLVGLKPCQRYQTLLKRKAQKIAEDARKQSCGLLPESCRKEVSFSYTPLVLDTDVYSTLSKIKPKSKKGRKTRHKKLKSFIPVARQETSLAGLLDTNESKILLVGKPGIGKTTVTHQMLRLWSEKDHRELDYMFYFNMRDISFRTNPRCLEDLLFNMYCEPEESREEVLEDIKKNSENAVIIFDGITDLSSNLVIKELLSHKLLPDAKIVITCRPEVHFEDFLTDCPTDWFRVEVKGFCDESIKAYLTKMLNAQPESLNSVLNNLELFSLCHVPMYALMVVACICSTPEASKQSWTTTTMYINILRHCIQEHSGKQLKDSQCLAEHREKILSLAEIAYKATEQKTMNLATLSHKEGSPQCAFLGAVMVKVLPTYSAFLHHTMQEFFGALWLLQNPDKIRDVLKKCQTKEWNHLMYLVPYLCGLLNEMNICLVDRLVPASQIKLTSDWFFKKLVKTFLPPERYNDHADCSATEFEIDLVFLCQCLYESQSSVACLLFLEKMDYHLDLSGEHLDPHHCCAVSYVISQSAENKVGLDLDSCTVSEQGLRLILGSLKNVRYLGSTPSILCQLWITLLSVEEEMDFTSLLGLCENELHLPVQGESRVFERAEDVMKQSSERVNLCLHWNQRTLLSEALNKTILECLSNINKLSFAPLQDQRGSLESLKKSVLLHLCLQAAFYHRETFLGAVNTLLSMFSVYQTERYDILLDLYSYVKNKINQSDRSLLLLLTPLYQSAPAVWSIDLSERKTSLLLEVLKLQPEKKLVELKGWSDEESEVRSFLQCLPYISQLSFYLHRSKHSEQIQFLVDLLSQAAEWEEETGEKKLKLVSSVCSYSTFPFRNWDSYDEEKTYQSEFLLDLYSHVKDYETQTGRSVLPSLQPVYQSASPAVWSIDLSERKTSFLLEVLKLQPEKKPVKLKGWSDEESEVRSFLQCLPYISKLRLLIGDEKEEAWSFLSKLIIAAAEYETKTGENVLKKLSSMCRYKENEDDDDPFIEGDFLLDLYSHVKHYETQTGRSVLPALQPVYQSAHVVWSIDLSKRKTSLLLEVLKLQPEKKPVELKGWSDEESEVRSFLQCLPYISQLSFTEQYQRRIPEEWRQREKTFLLNVCLQAVINEQRSLQTTLETVLSVFEVCQYQQWDLVLDLYSYVKDYETHTGRSVLPALQPVYQSAPPVWSIDLSERKTSILLEVLKLQPEKKPVVLKGWSDEESDVRSFLQCLPYISQLSCDDQFFLCLCEALSVGSEWDAHLCTSLLHAVDYTVVLSGWLPSVTCRTVGAVLGQSASGGKLNITLTPQSMSFQGARQLFKKVENLHKLRVNEMAVLKLARMAKFGSCHNPVLIEEMILDLSSPAVPEGVLRRVISSLASLLRCWPIRSLDLTDCQIEGYLLTSLLCHQGHLCTFRLNGESMQQLTDVVYEAQDKELTQCFLVKCGHDLSYCTLNWDVLQYLLQSTTQPITVNLRRSQFKPKDIIHLLPCLTNIHFKRINSRFKRTALREIYKQRAGHMVTTLLKSSDEWINLSNLVLDRYDCEALRFALHYSDGVKLNLLWTIVPKTEMRNILGLLHRVLTLRIDRELLLELLHACRDFGLQKTAVDLLRLLDHKLDLSCSSAMDLSRQEEGTVLSLTTGDCMVIASAVQVADCNTEINLHDCQVGNAGLEELIPVLHRVHLSIGKQILLQFLHLISVRDGDRSGRLALFLSRALGKELDLSQTPLDLVACSSLALILEYSEGLSELDLHNCNLTDNHLNCLLMHLHKVQVLNLSNNEVTDQGAIYVKDKLSRNGFTGTVWLHSRKATKPDNVLPEDKRYKVCLTYGESKRFSKTKAHFKEFDPVMKLVEGRISYSFQFGSRGRFKCTATGLIFGMKEPGTMEYSVEDWDMGILANTSYEPAGPLFQLNSPEGDIYQLQLPHCETEVYSAEDLHVAHMCINNMEFLRPKKVTQSHVIVAICGLSRFGNVRKRPFYQNRVQVKVGLFLEPDVTPTRQRLWVFLLPRNVPFTEVKEQHKEFVFIKTSPYCILRPKAKYSLTSDLKLGFKVQPKKYILHFDSSNDHHATFEVFLNHDITELHLKIQERTGLKALIRWSRLVILKTKSAKVSVQKLTESQWIESLCSILEQLTNKQMKKLKSLMMTTKERSHISKSTLEGLEDHCDVAQQMVWAWGMNGSIMATREFMDKLQRQDECVMSLLQPFLDQCDPM